MHELVARASETPSKVHDQDNDADSNNLATATVEGSSTTPNPHVVSVLYTNSDAPFKVAAGRAGESNDDEGNKTRHRERRGATKRKASATTSLEDMSSFADFEGTAGKVQTTDAKKPVPPTSTAEGDDSSSVPPVEIAKKPTKRGVAKVIKKSRLEPQY